MSSSWKQERIGMEAVAVIQLYCTASILQSKEVLRWKEFIQMKNVKRGVESNERACNPFKTPCMNTQGKKRKNSSIIHFN